MAHQKDPLFELALRLEAAALQDDYFFARKTLSHVDFSSGITYKALGIPTNMFSVMFAVARTVSWAAQWIEMIAEPDQRIGRPRQEYDGAAARDYVSIDERK